MQTYDPSAISLGFRVPAHPEGFERADWFDTFYGPLSKPITFAAASPLRCGYPSTPPDAGDYLSVFDATPTPFPGQGFYFLTAVHHAGQTRIGRRVVGGALMARDPTPLPTCGQ
jgi:hypothetical protein